MFTVVSLAWGEIYRSLIEILRESCERFKIQFQPTIIDGQPDDTRKARKLKPSIILNSLDGNPVMWIDADSRIIRDLDMLAYKDYDMAALKLNIWESSVIYCNDTEATRRTLSTWSRLMSERPDWKYDSEVFSDAVEIEKPKIAQLPLEMSWTEKFMRHLRLDADPVILHIAIVSAGGV